MKLIEVRGGTEPASSTLNDIHALRARVFKDRLGWNVRVQDGLETDEFDTLNPTYIAVISDEGRALGCSRMLPMSGRTMIGSNFSFLVDSKLDAVPGPAVESSRFCVDTAACAAAGFTGLNRATALLIAGMIDWAVVNGYATIATVTDIRIERLLRRMDVPFARLGQPQLVGATRAIAGTVPISKELADSIYPQDATRLADIVARAA
ncbi:acyl-homoserine-lactone synthase [Pelagibacterium lentulum]|uniref:acyl-homoserine-lactone synthase n=1 Tax=Pelagibacterium lentulum TaxID=2029865 RepID=UPI0013DE8D35|nr:acyl-homoserine-lactone synthase [Pelagibacterium lentulum]